MTLSHTFRSLALALSVAFLAPSPGAEAALIHGQSPSRPTPHAEAATLHAVALPAGAAAWRVAGPLGTDCQGCAEPAPAGTLGRRSSTLSVNLAILVLGTLWVGLMMRRIQLRSAMDGLRGAGPRHAAGGH